MKRLPTASEEEALRKLRPPRLKSEEVADRFCVRLIVLENVVLPENVLLSESSVVEAEPTVIELPTENCVPLIEPREPARRFVLIDEVAITLPFASVARSPPTIFGNQTVPKDASDEEAFWRFTTLVNVVDALNMFWPLNVLLSINRVEDAAVKLLPEVMQLPPIAKQPLLRLMPLENVELAPPPCVIAPVLEMEKSVVVALPVEDAITKRLLPL